MHVLASARPRGRPWSAPRAWRGDRELTLGQPRHGGQDAASPRAGPKSVRTAEAARAPKRYARGLPGHFAKACRSAAGPPVGKCKGLGCRDCRVQALRHNHQRNQDKFNFSETPFLASYCTCKKTPGGAGTLTVYTDKPHNLHEICSEIYTRHFCFCPSKNVCRIKSLLQHKMRPL